MSRENFDIKILKEIKRGNSNKAITYLYKNNRPLIINWIKKNRGNKEEAEDIFQDSVLAFYHYVIENPERPIENIKSFIFSIAKNKWINRTRSINKINSNSDIELVADEFNYDIDDPDKNATIDIVLSQLGDKCKQLLTYTIFYKISMEDIAKRMEFNNENTAKTKNYKCKKKLIELIKENLSYKDLLQS
jgi:RNA polymerase sigma factor (sigma-70 family)